MTRTIGSDGDGILGSRNAKDWNVKLNADAWSLRWLFYMTTLAF